MKEFIVTLIAGFALFGLAFLFFDTDTKSSLIKISIGLVVAILIKLSVYLWENWKKIRLILQSRVVKANKPIRISMAYLFRIAINGKYLLVRNHRDQAGYQPVGGVYRYLQEENSDLFNDIGIVPDHNMPVDSYSKNDLRKQIMKRKKLNKFIKWFESKKNRETDPWREFYEELIADKIIDGDAFPYIQYNLCRTHKTSIQSSVKFPIDEFLYADIYELKFENEKQREVFEKLFDAQSESYVFATPEEIISGHTSTGKMIIQHSKKILPC